MDLIQLAIQIYRDYFGHGTLMMLFMVSLLYLWVCEKNNVIRYTLVFLTSVMVVLFFFPIFMYVSMQSAVFAGETYYRILWLVPIYPTIAYALTKLIVSVERYWVRVGVAVVVGAVIIYSGQYTYHHISFTKAENVYHISQATVDLCDAMTNPDGWTDAVVPRELLESIKQYSPKVRLPYGREMLIQRWGFSHPLYDAMEAEVIDVALLAELAKEYYCEYIVLREDAVLDGNLEENGYKTLVKVAWYCVYQHESS